MKTQTQHEGNASAPALQTRCTLTDATETASEKSVRADIVPVSTRRKATGPRTAWGKKRSRCNAIKHGIFCNKLLLGNESRAECSLLIQSLVEYFQPEGSLEQILVEELAILLWRRRRVMQAERAEIAKASEGWEHDLESRLQDDAEARDRLAAQEGGLLRFRSNPAVLDRAIEHYELFRKLIREQGAATALGKGILTRLEGRRLEGDRTPMFLQDLCMIQGLQNAEERHWEVISQLCQVESMLARARTEQKSLSDSDAAELVYKQLRDTGLPQVLDARCLEGLDEYIEQLKRERDAQYQIARRRAALDAQAAVVPSPQVLDRLLRCEAHLSREVDRTLSRLERLKRMRTGQAVPPPLKVELSR